MKCTNCQRSKDLTRHIISRSNALSQVVRQEMTTSLLARIWNDVKFSSIQMVNIADHDSRHDGFIETDALEHLKEQLKQHKDKFDMIIVWFTDSIRIGAKCEHVTMLKKELSYISDTISVLCVKDAGKDLEQVAKSVEEYLETRAKIGNVASNVTKSSIQKKRTEIS